MAVHALDRPDLKDPPWTPITQARLAPADDDAIDIFKVLCDGPVLVHHPYASFATSVEEFIHQAATDPDVLAIKITLYRTSGDSPIVKSLIRAAERGKQVVALVELKARFDEQANIAWARALEAVGVHVVYGLVGLKTHTKTALVVRQEASGIVRYCHVATGNYNPKTARIYEDIGLLTADDHLGADLTQLFNYLTGYGRPQEYRKLLVAPLTLRPKLRKLIRKEMKERDGRIVMKMNSLVDPAMIEQLYEASQAGVEIDLIVRGICCLRPGVAGVSDRIRVISIVGRFLEHSRVWHFRNDGRPEYYIGSADWMPRNFDRRVEAVVPVEDPGQHGLLRALLDTCLEDNRQAWELRSDGTYVQRRPADGEPERATHRLMLRDPWGVSRTAAPPGGKAGVEAEAKLVTGSWPVVRAAEPAEPPTGRGNGEPSHGDAGAIRTAPAPHPAAG
jgi:polyphosphate kinase